jgi:hypothetical protein
MGEMTIGRNGQWASIEDGFGAKWEKGEVALGEMGKKLGEMGMGEMALGEMGINRIGRNGNKPIKHSR